MRRGSITQRRLSRSPERTGGIPTAAVAVAAALATSAVLGAIGADSRWLAALGREIVDRAAIPDGVPYASAPSAGWPNVLVLAELMFHLFDGAGERGFLGAQLLAVGVGFGVLALDARREGASDSATAVVLLVVAVGALTSILVVRLQLFSLALFPAALFLLRSQARRPSRRIWLLVPLIALWGNLHGAVLAGLAVATAYLLFERARSEPLVAAGVWGASVLALLATPALLETSDYYRGVLTNEAARRGFGLWEPLDITSPFDVLFLAAALPLLVLAARARPRLWELVALAGLAFLTLRTARSGVWLLFAAAPPAARGLPLTATPRRAVAAAVAFALTAITALGLARGPLQTQASPRVVRVALETAAGTPILAEPVLAEQIALAGGRVWMANPLDAFEPADQRLYLDWLEGKASGGAAFSHARRVVLVHGGSASERLVLAKPEFRRLAGDGNAAVYVRAR